MTLPWDNNPAPRPAAPQQPYTPPPPPQQYAPPTPAPTQMPAQDMQYDIKPKNKDLNTLIQEAINEAIVANKDKIQANAQRAIVKAASGKKPTLQHAPAKPKKADGENRDDDEDSFFVEMAEDIEGAWSGGPVTTRTFIQGMAVDMGFGIMAALATVVGPDFNAFDKQAWTLVGVLMLKTVIQTGMSYMMKLNVK